MQQNGPEIILAERKYLVGSHEENFPGIMSYAGDADLDVFRLTEDDNIADVSTNIYETVQNNIDRKGAIIFKGLSGVISNNQEFGKMVEKLGDKFSYTAGFATREEFGDAPGIKYG